MKLARTLYTIITVVVVTLLLLVLTGCYPVETQSEPGALSGFLGVLLTSAGIGAAIYFIFKDLPYISDGFDLLDSKAKRLTILIVSFVIPLGALSIGVWRGYYEFTDDTIFQALAAGFEAFTVSQIAHTVRGLGQRRF